MTTTGEQLAKLDRKRAAKGSNEERVNPHERDARITKMKEGRTYLGAARRLSHERSGRRASYGRLLELAAPSATCNLRDNS